MEAKLKFGGTLGDVCVPQDMPPRRRLIYNGLVGNFGHSASAAHDAEPL